MDFRKQSILQKAIIDIIDKEDRFSVKSKNTLWLEKSVDL